MDNYIQGYGRDVGHSLREEEQQSADDKGRYQTLRRLFEEARYSACVRMLSSIYYSDD